MALPRRASTRRSDGGLEEVRACARARARAAASGFGRDDAARSGNVVEALRAVGGRGFGALAGERAEETCDTLHAGDDEGAVPVVELAATDGALSGVCG